MQTVTTTDRCRICKYPLEDLLDLGPLALSTFLHPGEVAAHPPVPLTLARCPFCTLVQTRQTTPPDWLYRQYWYRSGINERMIEELWAVVETARAWLGDLTLRSRHQLLLDIGANDGTLLHEWGPGWLDRVAVEPAANLHESLWRHCSTILTDYFPHATRDYGRGSCAVITAIAMIYDLDDPLAFWHEISRLLASDGVCVVQFQDLSNVIAKTAFDTICHEHLEYFTLGSLQRCLEPNALVVQDVIPTSINGGSIRVVIQHRGRPTRPEATGRVFRHLTQEDAAGLNDTEMPRRLLAFKRRIAEMVDRIKVVLDHASESGLVVDGYGASTKGNTLLQVCDLGPTQIRQMIERSPQKVGLVTPTGIPIVSEEIGRLDPANLWICPIWQFRPQVLQREEAFLRVGGGIFFPLPKSDLVYMDALAEGTGDA